MLTIMRELKTFNFNFEPLNLGAYKVLLHRANKKLIEYRTFAQALPIGTAAATTDHGRDPIDQAIYLATTTFFPDPSVPLERRKQRVLAWEEELMKQKKSVGTITEEKENYFLEKVFNASVDAFTWIGERILDVPRYSGRCLETTFRLIDPQFTEWWVWDLAPMTFYFGLSTTIPLGITLGGVLVSQAGSTAALSTMATLADNTQVLRRNWIVLQLNENPDRLVKDILQPYFPLDYKLMANGLESIAVPSIAISIILIIGLSYLYNKINTPWSNSSLKNSNVIADSEPISSERGFSNNKKNVVDEVAETDVDEFIYWFFENGDSNEFALNSQMLTETTSIMEKIIDLHQDAIFFVVFIGTLVLIMVMQILVIFYYTKYNILSYAIINHENLREISICLGKFLTLLLSLYSLPLLQNANELHDLWDVSAYIFLYSG